VVAVGQEFCLVVALVVVVCLVFVVLFVAHLVFFVAAFYCPCDPPFKNFLSGHFLSLISGKVLSMKKLK